MDDVSSIRKISMLTSLTASHTAGSWMMEIQQIIGNPIVNGSIRTHLCRRGPTLMC